MKPILGQAGIVVNAWQRNEYLLQISKIANYEHITETFAAMPLIEAIAGSSLIS